MADLEILGFPSGIDFGVVADDPTVTPQDFIKGSTVVYVHGSGADLYVKQDDGSTTNFNKVGTGNSGIAKLGTVTVSGSASQAMVLSGLSVGLNKPLRLHWSIKNATGSSLEPRLYVNGDVTDANYQVAYYAIEDASDLAKGIRNYPQCGHVNPNEASTGFVDMSIGEDGYFRYVTSGLRWVGTGAAKHISQWFQGTQDTTVLTSLTAVRLDGGMAGAFAVNSTFTLWEYTV